MKHHKEYPVHFSHGEPRKISIPLDEYKHLKEIEKLYTELTKLESQFKQINQGEKQEENSIP